MTTLTAVLEHHAVTRQAWGVASLRVEEVDDASAAVGDLVDAVGGQLGLAAEGERLHLRGEWVDDARWGRRLQVELQASAGLADDGAAHRWLERLDGVGPILARRIAEALRPHGGALEVLRRDPDGPDPLLAVEGVGAARASLIREAFAGLDAGGSMEEVAYLDGIGLTRWEVSRVQAAAKAAGETPRAYLERDPYRLVGAVRGLGFVRADRIALRAGTRRDAPARLEAGVRHALEEATTADTLVGRAELLGRARDLLGVETPALDRALGAVTAAGDAVTLAETDPAGVTSELVVPLALLRAEREVFRWAT